MAAFLFFLLFVSSSSSSEINVGAMGSTRPVSKLYEPMSVEGSVVLITGATAGIGEATAWRFAEAGCKLILTGRRSERLEALKSQLVEAYPAVEVLCLTFDVQDLAKIEGTVPNRCLTCGALGFKSSPALCCPLVPPTHCQNCRPHYPSRTGRSISS